DATLTTQIYGTVITVTGASLSTNSAQSIAVDPAGNAYLAGVLRQAGNDRVPLYGSLDPTGMTIRYAFTFGNPNPGDGGAMNGVLYSNNFIYMTGTVNNTQGGTPLHQDLLLVKAQASTGELGGGFAFRWYVDDRVPPGFGRVGDWTGMGIALVNGNEPVVTGGAIDPVQYPPADPPTQGVDVHVTHFRANGAETVLHDDGDPENVFG